MAEERNTRSHFPSLWRLYLGVFVALVGSQYQVFFLLQINRC